MNVTEAYKIINKYQNKSALTPAEEFLLIEAYEYLISFEDDEQYIAMFNLASLYKRRFEYELALKYFAMSAARGGGAVANMEMADIYYYGYTGAPDYEKAFQYYSKAAEEGFPKAKLKLADLYYYGLYVEEDYDKYCALVKEIYDQIWDSPVPLYKGEAFFKLSEIYMEEDRVDESIELILSAQENLSDQLLMSIDDRDLDLMKEISEIIGETFLSDRNEIHDGEFFLYDLYYILKEPTTVSFMSPSGLHTAASHLEQGGITVEMDGQWFHNIDDFFYRATIDGKRLPALVNELDHFKILK